MNEHVLFISWGQASRGREAKTYEVFKEAHDFFKKKKKEGKVTEVKVYFNAHSSDFGGFMLIAGKPDFLIDSNKDLQDLYMKAAAVVDNLSLQLMIGGTDQSMEQHLDQWYQVQKQLGFA